MRSGRAALLGRGLVGAISISTVVLLGARMPASTVGTVLALWQLSTLSAFVATYALGQQVLAGTLTGRPQVATWPRLSSAAAVAGMAAGLLGSAIIVDSYVLALLVGSLAVLKAIGLVFAEFYRALDQQFAAPFAAGLDASALALVVILVTPADQSALVVIGALVAGAVLNLLLLVLACGSPDLETSGVGSSSTGGPLPVAGFMVGVAVLAGTRSDVLLVAVIAGPDVAGRYGVAARIAEAAALVLPTLTSAALPRTRSVLSVRPNTADVQALRAVTSLATLGALAVGVAGVIAARMSAGYQVAVLTAILATGQIFATALGPCGLISMARARYRIVASANALVALPLLLGGALAATSLGAAAMALAAALATVLVNSVLAIYAYRADGMKTWLRPLDYADRSGLWETLRP